MRTKKLDSFSYNPEIVGFDHYQFSPYEHDGLADIHSRSYGAEVLLEIRDVRVPSSSHHPSFTRLARHRTHLICYTHADLIDGPTRDKVELWTNTIWPDSQSIFVDTRAESKRSDQLHYFDSLFDLLVRTIDSKTNNTALTVGVPNVGKSSVLQALLRLGRQRGLIPKSGIKIRKESKISGKKQGLRKGGMPAIEDVPGKTRTTTEYLLRSEPKAFFMDVPGITPPYAFFQERSSSWFGFGATNLLPLGRLAGDDVELQKSFCNYVLSCANRDEVFHYVDKLGLNGPTDDVDEVLGKLCNGRSWIDPNIADEKLWLKRCQMFLKFYNTGNLGPLILDDMNDMNWEPFVFRDEHFQRRRDVRNDERGPPRISERGVGVRSSSSSKNRKGGGEHFGRRSGRNNQDEKTQRRPRRNNSDEYSNRKGSNNGDGHSREQRKEDNWRDSDPWFQTP